MYRKGRFLEPSIMHKDHRMTQHLSCSGQKGKLGDCAFKGAAPQLPTKDAQLQQCQCFQE